MHLFALSLSILSIPGVDKIFYSSNLYDEPCGYFSPSNPYVPSEIGFRNVCPKYGCFGMQI